MAVCADGTRGAGPARRGRRAGFMTKWHVIEAVVAGYLLLLARSAWKQGEFRQFLRSLLIVAVLCAAIAGAVMLAVALDS